MGPRQITALFVLADIANTRRIRAVVVNGRLLDRPALDAMLRPGRVESAQE